MPYKFKSPVAADLIMLNEVAEDLLNIIGKAPGPTGIITAAQVPAAVAAIQAEVARRNARPPASEAPADEDDLPEAARAPVVGLAQRAVPFIKLLERSAAEGKDVVWGV